MQVEKDDRVERTEEEPVPGRSEENIGEAVETDEDKEVREVKETPGEGHFDVAPVDPAVDGLSGDGVDPDASGGDHRGLEEEGGSAEAEGKAQPEEGVDLTEEGAPEPVSAPAESGRKEKPESASQAAVEPAAQEQPKDTAAEEQPEDPAPEAKKEGVSAEEQPEGRAAQEEIPSVPRRKKIRRVRKKKAAEAPVLLAEDGEDLGGEELQLPAEDGEALEEEELQLPAEDPDLQLPAEDAEEYEEDEEEEEELTPEERAARRGKIAKVLKIVFGSIFALIAIVYLGITFFFNSHFYYNTTVNGQDFSLKKVSDVEAYMKSQVDGYSLTLVKSDGGQEVISGSEVEAAYKESDELTKLLKSQNPFLWPRCIWESSALTAQTGVVYDEAKLAEKLASLECMKAENQVAPVSSKPEFDGNQFVPGAPQVGSQIEQTVFAAKVGEYISTFRDTLDMSAEECYVKPRFNQESPELIAACEEMNKYLQASVTLNFSPTQEVMDKAVISQWVTADENLAVAFNEEAVVQYVQSLADKYNTYGAERTFVAGNGNTVSVVGGDYGWILDKDAEKEALLNSIRNGEVITRDPIYSQTAATHEGADWGSTYVEVDLSNQYVYLFVNGGLVVSGPCVTGLPSRGDATPQGVYYIKYCQRNAVLRGPRQADGSYQWESPVSFWMPFNGGIGLHDASWQAAFGGSRYLTYGSRGCVNLQYSVAETIFNNVSAGTPVVCHY